MAIGDYGNNNNNNSGNNGKIFENTYFSRLRFKNADNKLALGFSFRSGLLILEISEVQDQNGFKYESLGSIFLSPTKARLFADEIRKFKEYLNSGDIIPNKAFGVNAGMGEKVSYIGIHADESKNIFITIGKIDGSGQIIEQVTMPLNKEYHFSLEWDNIQTMELSKVYNDELELDQLLDLLDDFARSMSGATAYSTIDLGRYDLGRILKKMDPIYDKLGIERMNSGSSYGKSNNFLDNVGKSSSTSTTLDDMENILG